MSPLEIIAVLLVALFAIKMLVLMVSPRAWYRKVVKPVYGNPKVYMWVLVALAAIILYYLLQELNIVQIFAATAFVTLLMGIGVLAFSKDILDLADRMLRKKNILKRAGLSILIWTVLSIWVLWTIFG